MLSGHDLTVFAVLGLLAVGIPVVSISAIAVLSILKIWCAFSWCWLLIPAGVLVAWAAIMCYAQG